VIKIKGLILAGGLGTRLRPISHTGPKQLVPIANKPVLHYCMEDFKKAGIDEIGIIVGYTKERIKKIVDSLGDGSKWGVKITYIEQDAPRGLAHAVWIAKDFLNNENFVVYLGDNLLKNGIKNIVDDFKNSDCDISLFLAAVDNPSRYGVAVLNENHEVIDVEEKPENPKTNLAIVGVYLFKPNIFDAIKNVKPGKKGELQITDAIYEFVKDSTKKVTGSIVKGWWDDTGTTDAVLRANHLILIDLESDNKAKIEKDVKIIGNVKIGQNTIIRKGSVIKGPLIIGENCLIGPDTYIGPYTSIGNDVKVIGGEIEASVVLDNAHIEFKNKIVDSLIGKHSIIKSKNILPKGHRLIMGENSEINF